MDIFSHHFKGDNTQFCSRIAYFSVGLIILMASLLLLFPLLSNYFSCPELMICPENGPCSSSNIHENCSFEMVESIPENLTFANGSAEFMSTFQAWTLMLKNAKTSVDLVSLYWTMMRPEGVNDSLDWQGRAIFQELLNVIKRGVKLKIIVSKTEPQSPDITTLVQAGADVITFDSVKYFGQGVLHTKLWIVDGEVMYAGSANMDWRSLTQVKELGVLIRSCNALLSDAQKLVDVYHYVASHDQVPSSWPCRFKTRYNIKNPMQLQVNADVANVYLSSSPPQLCPPGRTSDLNAILDIITSAKHFVYIAVMDYSPSTEFLNPNIFWPAIDNALRKVIIEKKIKVEILTSLWAHVKYNMLHYLKSLATLDGMGHGKQRTSVQAKMFCVPIMMPYQKSIPYSRVNHNKYMVTDEAAYIGTSNWSGDYFISTSGVGLIVRRPTSPQDREPEKHLHDVKFRQQLQSIFERDWYSNYSTDIWDVNMENFTFSCNSAF